MSDRTITLAPHHLAALRGKGETYHCAGLDADITRLTRSGSSHTPKAPGEIVVTCEDLDTIEKDELLVFTVAGEPVMLRMEAGQ